MADDADSSEHALDAQTASDADQTDHADQDDATVGDEGEGRPAATSPIKGRSSLRAALALTIAVLIALAGVGIWTVHQLMQERRADEHRQMLIGVGRQAAINLTTIDYTNAESNIQRILESSTGTFRDDFQQRSSQFVQAVTAAQSKSEGTVTEAGVESQDGNTAQVLIAVAVKTSTAGVDEPQPRAWRMRIAVTEAPGQDAKVSDVQFVP